MPALNDMDLIRDYADEHSERAFAELVRRHVNLVYSVALRHVGNAADAQDVAQAVFIVLANKAASLRHRSALTGWLYETTRFTATRLLRTRTRQQARADEQLRQWERHFRALIENSSDIISILDANGIIRYESPSIERTLGYLPDELIGRVGFQWRGTHKVSAKKEWPTWTPPPEMRARQRGLPIQMAKFASIQEPAGMRSSFFSGGCASM